jgi:outer membrane lipoprotein LolB
VTGPPRRPHPASVPVALALLLLLAACAPAPLVRPAADWPVRRAELQALEAWRLSGRVAVAAGEQGFSARLAWAQRDARSSIDLSGPFGAGAVHVDLAGDEIRLRDGDGAEVATGPDALATRLGFALPVRELRYWALGVPAPSGPPATDSAVVLGAEGRPVAFNDRGWWVRIEAWRPVAGDLLPARLLITRPGARLKLVVDDWRLGPEAP